MSLQADYIHHNSLITRCQRRRRQSAPSGRRRRRAPGSGCPSGSSPPPPRSRRHPAATSPSATGRTPAAHSGCEAGRGLCRPSSDPPCVPSQSLQEGCFSGCIFNWGSKGREVISTNVVSCRSGGTARAFRHRMLANRPAPSRTASTARQCWHAQLRGGHGKQQSEASPGGPRARRCSA